ncbi:MAG: septum formation initiator family protein [Proteobacteria bacterium]|nr:septum formation initiator family protein [Pseudomonadota bacterium]MBU1639483.1 septum formation initiator family protein [Pseudomonadota bacterium]
MPATSLHHLSNHEKKTIFIFSLLFITILAFWLLFSPKGGLKFYSVQKELNEIEQANTQLHAENQSLRQEIEKLKTDSVYLEKVAREKGLLKRDEMVFVFN